MADPARACLTLARAYPPGHLARLRQLKHRYDPNGLFRDNFYIPPAKNPTI